MKIVTKVICVGVAVILPTGFAEARIGASLEECKAAYGSVRETRSDGKKISYQRDAVLANCWFLNEGRCDSVTYQRLAGSIVDVPEIGKEPRFSRDQSMALLNLNRGSSTWSQVSRDQYGEDYDGIYVTADGKVRACVSRNGVALESVEDTEQWKKKCEDQSVTATIASFSQGASDGPEIRQDAPVPPPTAEEIEAQRSAVEMEKMLQDWNKSQEEVQKASDKLQDVLNKVAARVAKKEEIERHIVALPEIQKAMEQSKNEADRIAAEKREAEWNATARRLAAEYEVLKEESTKGE